jgi:hypothetical protein
LPENMEAQNRNQYELTQELISDLLHSQHLYAVPDRHVFLGQQTDKRRTRDVVLYMQRQGYDFIPQMNSSLQLHQLLISEQCLAGSSPDNCSSLVMQEIQDVGT